MPGKWHNKTYIVCACVRLYINWNYDGSLAFRRGQQWWYLEWQSNAGGESNRVVRRRPAVNCTNIATASRTEPFHVAGRARGTWRATVDRWPCHHLARYGLAPADKSTWPTDGRLRYLATVSATGRRIGAERTFVCARDIYGRRDCVTKWAGRTWCRTNERPMRAMTEPLITVMKNACGYSSAAVTGLLASFLCEFTRILSVGYWRKQLFTHYIQRWLVTRRCVAAVATHQCVVVIHSVCLSVRPSVCLSVCL